MITISAFRDLPKFAHGLARDLRVRWALEEAGLPYRVMLLELGGLGDPGYRALQPFGQVPMADFDGFVLFESGAIVQHIAESCDALMPADPQARARARAWMFAALNTVETSVQGLGEIDFFNAAEPWAVARRPAVLARVETRLDALEARLAGRDYLEDRFTAGDLLMTTVIRILRHTDLVRTRPKLNAYQARCEARPAFRKALADHVAPFAAADAA
jgi:glutathione S-transferase